jgi:TPP-dependent pyruvate/acetoin dehydrogenase alpha subunit
LSTTDIQREFAATPIAANDVDEATRLKIFETTAVIFAADEKLRELLMTGKIAIIYYSPRGQEVLAAAAGAAQQAGDYTVTTYRGLHDMIAGGAPLKETLAEMLGKGNGTCRGKGGPMHISDPASGVMVTTGIVGAGMPIANGLALASKMKRDGKVTFVNFGDGATNIGAFHEALNMAAIWDLPVVFICQNNQYGEFTPRLESQKCEHVADRAAAYGMPGVTVDGNDAAETYNAVTAAAARARSGGGPTLVECNTFRFMGHYFGETQEYMPQDVMAAAMAADPVPRQREQLLSLGVEESVLAEIEQRAAQQVDEAIEFALSSPPPNPLELFDDVYAERVSN